MDILAVVPKLGGVILEAAFPDYWKYKTWFFVRGYLSLSAVFRALRLLKVGKHHMGLRVMALTIKASLTEMGLLLFLIIISGLLFSVCIFFSDIWDNNDFFNMPSGMWWAIITMTTVGYGDMYPRTLQGKIVGILCALTGVLATGLPVPIIAKNFDLYYTLAKIRQAIQARKEEMKGFDYMDKSSIAPIIAKIEEWQMVEVPVS